MRTVPAAMTPEMQKVLTQSTWLIRLITRSVPAQTIYMSSEGQVDWGGVTWYAQGVKMIYPVTFDDVSFSMPNADSEILTMVASGELKRAPAALFVMYPGASEAVQFMAGFVRSVSGLMTNRATLQVSRYANANRMVPNVFIAPPNWNKLPPRDLTLEWAGKTVTLTN